MSTLLKNASIFTKQGFRKQDVLISDHRVLFTDSIDNLTADTIDTVYDLNGLFMIPGSMESKPATGNTSIFSTTGIMFISS